jgi:hypothetical protein
MRRRDIALDEIKEELQRHHGHGMDQATKAAKAATLESVSGTRAWAKLESMRLAEVQQARNALWKLTRGHEYGSEPILPESPKAENVIDEGEIPHEPKAEAA